MENSTPHGAGRWPTPWRMLPVVQNPRKNLESGLGTVMADGWQSPFPNHRIPVRPLCLFPPAPAFSASSLPRPSTERATHKT